MEWFQVALDRYKEQSAEDRPPSRAARSSPARTAPRSIVYTRTRSLAIPESELRERRILSGFDRGAFVDAFKILRTQVTHRMRENGWNLLGVTSPGELEGKTLTAVNLAVSLAMDVTQTVLLVDTDLRKPAIDDIFGLDGCRGLSDYLLDDIPIEDLLIHPNIGRFVLLPGGRAIRNSTEALTSPKMLALVEELKHRYHSRMIIFDLPPLLLTSDVLAFSPYVDALLMVVEEGRTKAEDLERALSLVKSPAQILGTVMNKAGKQAVTPAAMKRVLSL